MCIRDRCITVWCKCVKIFLCFGWTDAWCRQFVLCFMTPSFHDSSWPVLWSGQLKIRLFLLSAKIRSEAILFKKLLWEPLSIRFTSLHNRTWVVGGSVSLSFIQLTRLCLSDNFFTWLPPRIQHYCTNFNIETVNHDIILRNSNNVYEPYHSVTDITYTV